MFMAVASQRVAEEPIRSTNRHEARHEEETEFELFRVIRGSFLWLADAHQGSGIKHV